MNLGPLVHRGKFRSIRTGLLKKKTHGGTVPLRKIKRVLSGGQMGTDRGELQNIPSKKKARATIRREGKSVLKRGEQS